jgi:hypothetical protein
MVSLKLQSGCDEGIVVLFLEKRRRRILASHNVVLENQR